MSTAFVVALVFPPTGNAQQRATSERDDLQSVVNLATAAEVVASSHRGDEHLAKYAIDSIVSDASRWISGGKNGPHTLTLTLSAKFQIASAHIYSGWRDRSALSHGRLEFWTGTGWKAIPGGEVKRNPTNRTALRIIFEQPIETTKVRLVSLGDQTVRIRELSLFGVTKGGSPPLGTGVKTGEDARDALAPDLSRHHVLANQIGYNRAWKKRFTAPASPDGSEFVIRDAQGGLPLFTGTIQNHLGDFTELNETTAGEVVIEVEGANKTPGRSFPFRIEPLIIQQSTLEPALRFMVDCRSVVGTHPSAYGGHPWRDGTYYTFETPSLVLLYLANPAFFQNLQIEIDYRAERKRILAPRFKLVKSPNDRDALPTTRKYYQQLDPPVGKEVPDLIQLLHWGIGFQMLDPMSEDPSGDPLGEILHPQTVEQFAFFLYGFPYFERYFTERFHQQTIEFTMAHWEKVGLFELFTEIGSFKGRQCPGHSIAPNLMMYQVARRLGLDEPERFRDAAIEQTRWLIDNIDPQDPRIARGQRMSEHKLMLGLFMLHKDHPEEVPEGFYTWIGKWLQAAIARSDNMYDFRKFDEKMWTLPKPWSDPGSVAGFPGIAVMLKAMIDDDKQRNRLDELKASHFDSLFGRNPVNAASANRAAEAFPGLDRGWPKKYGDNICARLELCRGTLNTIAAHEHYPFQPRAGFRHPEGWSGFNAAFNVSLAFCCWDDAELSLDLAEGDSGHAVERDEAIYLSLVAPLSTNETKARQAEIEWSVGGKTRRPLILTKANGAGRAYRQLTTLKDLGIRPGQDAIFSYGSGLFAKKLTLTYDDSIAKWRASSAPR